MNVLGQGLSEDFLSYILDLKSVMMDRQCTAKLGALGGVLFYTFHL